MSLRRSGPGVRSGFLETPRTRFVSVFLASLADRVLVGRSRGFDASGPTPVSGGGCRSRAARRARLRDAAVAMGLDERGPFGGRAKEPHTSSITAPRLAERAGLANIRSHADQDQHVCRPPSTPMLNRFYLFYISLFSSPLFYLCMGCSSRHPLQHDRSPSNPPRSSRALSGVVVGGQRVSKSQPSLCTGLSIPRARSLLSLVRDFRPLIPAHGDRRLHGRLGG